MTKVNITKKIHKTATNLLGVVWIRNFIQRANFLLLTIVASNRLFATIYAIPSFMTFNREQYAVLRGRLEYYRNLHKAQKSKVELRRSVHRIEKGLTMQPQKKVFAKEYIEDAVGYYEVAVGQYVNNKESFDVGELEWAHNVFGSFFGSIKPGISEAIDTARKKYKSTFDLYAPISKSKKPYLYSERAESDVKYNDFLNLTLQRRSIRWFKQKKVSRGLIDNALLAARQSPTACNRMPYTFKIYDDPSLVKEIARIPFGSAGYSHQIPTIVVVVGELNSYSSPRDRHAIYVDSSLAAMSFMLALETLGLSSSVINWPDFEPLELKMQKKLNLSPSQRVTMLIAVGYGDDNGKIPYSQKKSLETFRTYNEERTS